jgi:hypothetical protein
LGAAAEVVVMRALHLLLAEVVADTPEAEMALMIPRTIEVPVVEAVLTIQVPVLPQPSHQAWPMDMSE